MNGADGAFPRRPADRLRDWATVVALFAGFAVLLGAVVAGFVVHARESERSATERAGRTEVAAVLLAEAQYGDASSALPVHVDATWTTPAGRVGTGQVTAAWGTPAGTRLTAWLDADGRPVDAPVSASEAVLAGVLATFSVLALGGLAVALVVLVACRVAARSEDRYWEREWARIEPRWRSGHSADQG